MKKIILLTSFLIPAIAAISASNGLTAKNSFVVPASITVSIYLHVSNMRGITLVKKVVVE